MAVDARRPTGIHGPRPYPLRVAWLYGRMLRQHVLARLSYETDFLLTIGASALTQALGFIFLQVVFSRIPSVRGWTFWQTALLYAMLLLVRGLAAAFGEGAWSIGAAVQRGGLDRLLLQPMPVLVQLYGSGLGWSALADIGLGAAIAITAGPHVTIVWSPRTVAALAVALPSGAAVYWSAMLAANSIAFWTIGSRGPVAFMVHGVSELAKFPLTVYPRLLADVLTWCLPFAFLSFYPAQALVAGPGLTLPRPPVHHRSRAAHRRAAASPSPAARCVTATSQAHRCPIASPSPTTRCVATAPRRTATRPPRPPAPPRASSPAPPQRPAPVTRPTSEILHCGPRAATLAWRGMCCVSGGQA